MKTEIFKKELKIGHDCSATCGYCNGSGEGMYDGSSCRECKGRGVAFDRGYIEEEVEVEWTKPDFSDVEIIEGPGFSDCEACGIPYIELVIGELEYQANQVKDFVEIKANLA
jgi:hypothetical protein